MQKSLQKLKWFPLILMTAIGFVAVLGITRSAVSQTSPSIGPPDPTTLSKLHEVASKIAETYGDKQPSNGRALGTTRRALAGVVGSDLPIDDAVFVVVMHGKFTSSGPRPYGTEAPTGTVLTVAFDPSTLEVTDLMLTPSEPDLAQLGTLVPLGP